MEKTVLDRFFEVEHARYGKARYFFKPETLGSKIRAFYIRPFCPEYMEQFSTALYPDTHFARKKKGDPVSCVRTEFHENVHKFDRHNQGFKFTLKYLYPQLYAIPLALAAVVAGGLWSWLCFGAFLVLLHSGLFALSCSAKRDKKGLPTGKATISFYVLTCSGLLASVGASIYGGGYLSSFLWCGALLLFSPWPFKSIWRRDSELRGYTMSLYRVWLEHKGSISEAWWACTIEKYVARFAGPNYFFMETNKSRIRRELVYQSIRFRGGDSGFLAGWRWKRQKESSAIEAIPFKMAKKFMQEEGMVSNVK